MAKVAKVATASGSLPMDQHPFRGGGAMKACPVVKRKTPSELRGEQLKRRITSEFAHDSSVPLENNDAVDYGIKKPEGLRSTRYVDMRLDEVFHARKPISRFSLLSVKSNPKEKVSEENGGIKSNLSFHVTARNNKELSSTSASIAKGEADISKPSQTAEKDCQNMFRSVAELSFGGDRVAQLGSVDMDKALKGLGARESSGSSSPTNFIGTSGDIKSASSLGKFCSEIHISGREVPLDFSLKTTMRIISSSPVDRFHRLLMGGTYNGNQSFGCASIPPTSADSFSLHSWIYPQSSLPSSVISLLNSSKGGADRDFLNKRHLAWEDSFRCLYYMLRKSRCNVFYVCSSQFVVMFSATGGMGKSKRTCNAYISQSTSGLRSLLREHDVGFSMPLCSEIEQISREDLVELSEIEKHNFGQAKRMLSMPDADNSPKSLLAFSGNESVHNLYDFLLNYRSLLTMLAGVDVPILCAPISFLNAALSSPEVRCKEVKRADPLLSKGSITEGSESLGSTYYIIEINDAYLPPWTICSICATLGSDGRSFEASFMTEPNSVGLNVCLEAAAKQKSDTDETIGDSEQFDDAFGISEAVVSLDLHSAYLKGLKYSNESYVAYLSPI